MSRRLAVEGGSPAFVHPLHVGRPNVGDRAAFGRRVERLLDDRWLTNDGPLVQEFEAAVAEHLGVAHCVATSSGTSALELALRGTGATGEVVVPAATFVATAHAVAWSGLRPVFCEIDAATHNLDPGAVEAAITDRTSAILGVHLWGRPCAPDVLDAIAAEHGLTMLYDAAHAFSCSSRGTTIGRFGDAEVLSFHATKFVNSFEGGAVVTSDEGLAEEVRRLRNFGFTDYDRVEALGTNAKLTEVAAAMGLTSLESIEVFRTANHRNHERYRSGLRELPGLHLLRYDDAERTNRHYAVAEVGPDCPLSRDELQQVLWAEGVLARRYFWPGCHRMEPYRTDDPERAGALPVTDGVLGRTLVLPTGEATSADDVDLVCDILASAIARAEELRPHLDGRRQR